MILDITCPRCLRKLRLLQEHRGKEVRCPSCRASFLAESSPEAPAPPRPLPEPILEIIAEPPGPVPGGDREAAERNAWRRKERERPAPREKPLRKSESIAKPVAICMAVIGALVVAVVVVSDPPWEKDREPLPRENPQDRLQDIRDALRDDVPLADEAVARELKPLFASLGTAFRNGDKARLRELFHAERLVQELEDQNLLPPEIRRNRNDFLRGVRLGLGEGLAKAGQLLQWESSEIRHIRILRNGEAVAIVRHRDADATILKMRWWLIRAGGQWRVYDFEDLDLGQRASLAMGQAAAQGVGKLNEYARAGAALREALIVMAQQQDADAAEGKLRSVAHIALPPIMEAVRKMAEGMIHSLRGDAAKALASFEQAGKFNADMPILDFLAGLAHNQLGQWDKAWLRLEKYRALMGDEPNLARERGLALRGLSRFAEAAEACRKCLDENPKDADAYHGLLHSLAPHDPMDDLEQRFRKLDDQEELFDTWAPECFKNGNGEEIERMARALRHSAPDHPSLDRHLSLGLALGGKADEAMRIGKAALAREPNEEIRKEHLQQLLETLGDQGKAVEAWRSAPDQRRAFALLAVRLQLRYKADDLARLVAAHAKNHADDPLLPFCRAEAHHRLGSYKLADKDFQAGMAKPPDDETLATFRHSRVLARYHVGEALAALKDIGPRVDTFPQLAWLALNAADWKTFDALMAAQTRDEPLDPLLAEFRLRVLVKRRKTAEAVALFKGELEKRKDEEDLLESIRSAFFDEMKLAGLRKEAYQAAPDARQAFQRLLGYFDDDDEDDAGEFVEADRPFLELHRAQHPDDPWLHFREGELHCRKKEWDKAAKLFEKAWGRSDKELRARMRWRFAETLCRTGKALHAYQRFEPRVEIYGQLANLLCADKDFTQLDTLIAAHRPHADNDPDLLWHQARAKVFAKQPEKAVALFNQAWEKQPHLWQRSQYVSTFVQDMKGIGQALQGYRAAPDKAQALDSLASSFVDANDAEGLRELLALANPDLRGKAIHCYYLGQEATLRKDPVTANVHFSAANTLAGAKKDWRFRAALLKVRIRLGKIEETLREFRADPQTFAQMAEICLTEKGAEQMRTLLALRRKADADDPQLPRWDLELFWLDKDYPSFLALLDDEERSPLPDWQRQDRRVRCLARLGRHADALASATKGSANDFSILPLLALAFAGDVDKAIAAAEKGGRRAYFLSNCYDDDDLGPILKGAKFKPFRDKFPEPKKGD